MSFLGEDPTYIDPTLLRERHSLDEVTPEEWDRARRAVTVEECKTAFERSKEKYEWLHEKPKLTHVFKFKEGCEGVARCMSMGYHKYGPEQPWEDQSWQTACESLSRHLAAAISGDELDEESLLWHLDHAASRALQAATLFRREKNAQATE